MLSTVCVGVIRNRSATGRQALPHTTEVRAQPDVGDSWFPEPASGCIMKESSLIISQIEGGS